MSGQFRSDWYSTVRVANGAVQSRAEQHDTPRGADGRQSRTRRTSARRGWRPRSSLRPGPLSPRMHPVEAIRGPCMGSERAPARPAAVGVSGKERRWSRLVRCDLAKSASPQYDGGVKTPGPWTRAGTHAAVTSLVSHRVHTARIRACASRWSGFARSCFWAGRRRAKWVGAAVNARSSFAPAPRQAARVPGVTGSPQPRKRHARVPRPWCVEAPQRRGRD